MSRVFGDSAIILVMVVLPCGITWGENEAKRQESADSARRWILDALEAAPMLDRPRRGYGQIAALLEDYSDPAALDELEEILTRRWDAWPEDARNEVRALLTRAWIELDNIERARHVAADAPEALRKLAHHHISESEYETALRLGQKIGPEDDYGNVHRWIAKRQAENGRVEAAMNTVEKAPTQEIRDWVSRSIAEIFAEQGNAKAARNAIRQIEETRPADEARRYVARRLAGHGQKEQALALVERITDQRTRRNALEDVREALNPEPDRPQREDRTTVRDHLKAGNLEEAIELAREPESTAQQRSRLEIIATQLIEAERFDRVEGMIAATEFPPNRFSLYSRLAEAYRRVGRPEETRRILQRMAELRPALIEQAEQGGMYANFSHASADAVLAYHHGQLENQAAFRNHAHKALKTGGQIDPFFSLATYHWLVIAFKACDRMDLLREWVRRIEDPQPRFRATILIFRALREFEGRTIDQILHRAF